MNGPRHYPTDLVIAVSEARATLDGAPDEGLAALLGEAHLRYLRDLFDADEIAAGLDGLCGGIAQYPWQPVVDSNDVYEFSPVGTIVVDDRYPDATLRATLHGWALGNEVVIRTERRLFWLEFTGQLRSIAPLLPAAAVVPSGSPAAGVHVHVPRPMSLPPDAHLAAGTALVWREDCRADWVRALRQATHLRGIPPALARAREDATTGRLDARLRYLVHRARRAPNYRTLPEAHGISVYARTDWDNMVREAIPLFHAMGSRPGDRPINTLFGGDLYGGLTATLTECTRMPVETYTTAQSLTPELLLGLIRDFGADALIGVPTLIMPLLREAHALDPDLRLSKIFYLGTPLSTADDAWLRTHLDTHTVSSVLAANDVAQLGYQCGEMSGALHHVNDDFNYLEVVDPEGNPVAEGAVGDLLTTTLQKFEGPLIRYRAGDRGRVFRHACAFGVTGRVLEYHGRADGVIHVKGQVVLHDDMERELAHLGVCRVQAEIASEGGREVLTILTESSGELNARAVREHLQHAFPVLRDDHTFDDGLTVFELHVISLRDGALRRRDASGKVRPVVDLRLAPA
ncbi:phenylacetate--CoA ligase family protein [Streptomyces sp. NPDC058308]|uniref:phenylacetate--CoA ligase family protein n=1 Tax=Streptomyces sp. NPDC058308 TaxID=3346440 RepID=UPI0036E631DA